LYIVTTPIVEDPALAPRDQKIYGPRPEVAKRPARARHPFRWLAVAEGATLGMMSWLLLFTLGVPWAFHIGGFDGLAPAAVVGAIMGATVWRRVPLVAVMTLSVILLVIVYTPVIVGPARSLIRNDPLPRTADAIMVLSAGVSDEGMVSPQSVDRLMTGLEYLNRGVAPALIISREAYLMNGRLVSSRHDQGRIISLVPGALSKTFVAGVAHSTREEALRAAVLFRRNGWKRIVLVTSPLHTRRACATFERLGMVVTCAASDTRDFAVREMADPGDRLRAFQLWLYETAGSLDYRLHGWI
jgi:uncharacterized SAM-binding protein YcdF (DUF218 family)